MMIFGDTFCDLNGTIYCFADVDNLPHTKENALAHRIVVTCRSWTFHRMTQAEKERCIESFLWANEQGCIVGSFQTRWNITDAIYNAFLSALGYDGGNWRAR